MGLLSPSFLCIQCCVACGIQRLIMSVWNLQECSFRAPIPSSLAIAAALAAGEMPFLSRCGRT